MSNPYVVSVECMVIVSADNPDSAADIARSQLEEVAFDVVVTSAEKY